MNETKSDKLGQVAQLTQSRWKVTELRTLEPLQIGGSPATSTFVAGEQKAAGSAQAADMELHPAGVLVRYRPPGGRPPRTVLVPYANIAHAVLDER